MNAVTDALASHGIRSDFLCGVDVDGDREVYTVKNGRVSALLEVVNGTLDEMRAAHALRVFKDACSAADTARQAAEDAKHVEDTKKKIQRKLNIMKEQIGVFDWHGRRARGERLQSNLADMRERLSAAFGRDDVDALLESVAQEQNTVQSDIRVIRQTLKLTEPTPTQMLRNDALRVLGLSEPFDVQALKSSYRTLCRTAHPDRGGSKDQFQRVQNAYAMLLQSLEGESQAAASAPTPVLGKRRSDDPSSVSSKKRALNSVERHAATPAVVSAVPKTTTSNGPPKKLSPKPFNTDAPKKIIPKPGVNERAVVPAGVIKKIIPKPNVSAAKKIIPKPVAVSVEEDDGAGVFDLITNPREYHNLRRQPTLEGKTDDFRRAVSDTMQLWEFDESTSNPYRGPITDEEREKKLINTIETMSQKWVREGRDVVM